MNRLSFALTGIALLGMDLSAVAAQAAEVQPGLGEPIEIHRNLSAKEWPQLQNTPQRTGYSPVKIAPPFEEKWRVCLCDLDVGNKIQRTVQPIIAGGTVYLGCKNGRFFALDAGTGEVKWTFDAGGPIRHTAGYSDGKVFFAAFDGCVYCLDAATGKEVWVFNNERRHGFSTAVLLAGDRLYAVDRGGRLFCVRQSDGKEVWHYDAGAPVFQSPAYNAGRIYFADEHMQVHAVSERDGSRLWQSKKLVGASFQFYWPVVVHGMVIVRSLADDVVMPHGGEYHNDDPWQQSLFLLDEATGEELPVVEHYVIGVHQGTVPPPAVTRDGLMVMRWSGGCLDPKNKHVPMGAQFLSSPSHGHIWVLQDIQKQGKMVAVLEPDYVPDSGTKGIAVGLGPPDETSINTVLGDLVTSIISMGWREYGQAGERLSKTCYSRAHGIYSLSDQRWHWEGISEAAQYGNQFTGGVSAVSGADGLFYNTSWNWVQCHGSAEE